MLLNWQMALMPVRHWALDVNTKMTCRTEAFWDIIVLIHQE
jgi:leucyl aminopeptidase (aminopeptidase T)